MVVEIILLENVAKVGKLGQRMNVKPGFARNFLIPTGKALPATAANVAQFDIRKAELEKAAADRLELAKSRAAKLEGVVITIAAQAGEEGRLFGSVGIHEIAKALKAQGHEVSRTEIRLPAGPIRMIGEHEIELQLQGSDFSSQLKVAVVPN